MTTNIFANPPAQGAYNGFNMPAPTAPLPYIPSLPTPNVPLMTQTEMWNQMQQMQREIESLKAGKAAETQIADIEKQLVGTQKGREYLRMKQEGAVGILVKWALQNPIIAQDMQKFLDGWKDKASEYLNNLESSKKSQTQGVDK